MILVIYELESLCLIFKEYYVKLFLIKVMFNLQIYPCIKCVCIVFNLALLCKIHLQWWELSSTILHSVVNLSLVNLSIDFELCMLLLCVNWHTYTLICKLFHQFWFGMPCLCILVWFKMVWPGIWSDGAFSPVAFL